MRKLQVVFAAALLAASTALAGPIGKNPAVESKNANGKAKARAVRAQALPADSLYHWEGKFRDQHGNQVSWTLGEGSPVLVSMFYSTCPMACPMLISSIKHLERQLTPEARARLVVVLISMDPARDTAEANQQLAKAHGVDQSRWHFLQPEPDAVPEIAALLGMTYRKNADGSFSHSMQVTALRPDGTVAAVRGTPNDDPAVILQAL